MNKNRNKNELDLTLVVLSQTHKFSPREIFLEDEDEEPENSRITFTLGEEWFLPTVGLVLFSLALVLLHM